MSTRVTLEDGYLPAVGRPHVEHRQRRRVALVLRRDPHDHLVGVVGRVDLRDLPRSERAEERPLDLIGREPERRHARTVERDVHLRVRELQIARDVHDAGDRLELRLELRRRGVEVVGIAGLQRELVLRARLPAADVDDRRVLQEHADARDGGELRPQLVDHLVGA